MKSKEFRVFIAIPAYGGSLTVNTFHGILDLIEWSKKNLVKIKIETLSQESLISRGRNKMVDMAINDKDFDPTHFLFVDSDIGFSSKNFERLLNFNKDIACGVYPLKDIHWAEIIQLVNQNKSIEPFELESKSYEYTINFLDRKNIVHENGFVKVKDAATGFMLVKMDVFKEIQKKYPDRFFKSRMFIDGKMEDKQMYDFFPVGINLDNENKTKLYLSEDYFFSELWRNAGGEIWSDISMPLSHYGFYTFKGSIGYKFTKK